MLQPPQPCPWEERCADCTERQTCPSWREYLDTNSILYEQVERGNLRRTDFDPIRPRKDKTPNWDKIKAYNDKATKFEWQ